jgi:uncharacterized protein
MDSTSGLRTVLKALLVEGWEQRLPDMSPREVSPDVLQKSRLITVVGPRRGGKTYLCYQWIRHLLAAGIPRKAIIWINWEDERLPSLSGRELTELLPAYLELQRWDEAQPLYFFLDEIQNVPFWSKWTRRILEQHPSARLILTGSSSKLLSTELATELRGRGLTVELYPYSFREWLQVEKALPEVSEALRFGQEAARLLREFDLYMSRGGFPAVRHDPQPRAILQEYYRTMFLRDLVERHKILNIQLLEDFLKIQISRFAALSSLSNIHKALLDVHGRISKTTLSRYARAAKEILLLFEAERYSAKARRHLLFPKKIYAVDHGLLEAVRFSATEDRGRLLENMVYLELKRRGYSPFYFKEARECDFVIQDGTRVIAALQSAWDLSAPETRDREMQGLISALDALHLTRGWIITRNDFEDVTVGLHTIHVRPFWYFALDLGAVPRSTGASWE